MKWYPSNYSGGTENKTVTFTQAEKRENIKSGEKHKTLFGKIARWFADLKTVAFTGSYNDLTGKPASLPASDVSAWAKAASKPSYNWNEIGSKPSSFPPSSHKHSKSDITDFPSSLPASDVKAWAKAANKPSYNWSEIGGKPSLLGATRANGYCGMATDNCEDDQWIRTTTQGIIPYQSGAMGNSHCSLGHSNWWFKNGYIENIETNQILANFVQAVASSKTFIRLGADIGMSSCYENSNGNKIYFRVRADYNNSTTYRTVTFQTYASSKDIWLEPDSNNVLILGSATHKIKEIFGVNSTISTSDIKEKKEISYIGENSGYEDTCLSDEKIIRFIRGLKPVAYKRIDGESGRPHHGFIAQDVEKLVQGLGIKDHAGFIKSPKMETVEIEEEAGEVYIDGTDGQIKTRTVIQKREEQREIPGEYIYGLRYEEFIADIVYFCQILYNRNTGLENALKEQKEKAENLEKRIEALENIIKQTA